MHSYRYPQVPPPFSEVTCDDGTTPTAPGGSLAGTAFAISAAVMPLLRSGDVAICSAALSVLQKSLPLCMEPIYGLGSDEPIHELIGAGVAEESAMDLMARMTTLCTERLQHLISRLEQVSYCRDVVLVIDLSDDCVILLFYDSFWLPVIMLVRWRSLRLLLLPAAATRWLRTLWKPSPRSRVTSACCGQVGLC